MKHSKIVNILTVCAVFMLCAVMANAQSVQTQGTKSANNAQVAPTAKQVTNPDEDKFAQVQQEIADQNTLKQQTYFNSPTAKYNQIPGFEVTGDDAVDHANYEQKKAAFKANNPAGYQQMLNDN